MINTLPKVKISLTLGKGNHLKLVLLEVIWSINVNSFFQVHQGLSKGPASKRAVVKPRKEIPGRDMVIEDFL